MVRNGRGERPRPFRSTTGCSRQVVPGTIGVVMTTLTRMLPAPVRIGTLGILLACGSLAAAPAPLLGPEFRVNTTTSDSQKRSSTAMDSAGNFVVVWQSAPQDGSGTGIFGQRYDVVGQPLGAEFQINTYTTASQERPSVAMDASTSRFVVVWQSSPQDGSGWGVFGQRFDSDGVQLGAEFPVNAFTTGDQTVPDVAVDDQGNFVTVWQRQAGASSPIQMVGRRFDAQGSALGDEFVVSDPDHFGWAGPAVAAGADGDFVVAWTDYDFFFGDAVV